MSGALSPLHQAVPLGVGLRLGAFFSAACPERNERDPRQAGEGLWYGLSAEGVDRPLTRFNGAGGRRFRRPAGEIASVLAPADEITEREPDHASNQHRDEGILWGILADVLC